MEEDILNFSPIVIFRKTGQTVVLQYIVVKELRQTSLYSVQMDEGLFHKVIKRRGEA